MNGQRNRANNFLLDGTDNNDQFTAGRVAVNPNVDMVQEFRISTNNFSAEFGRNSASVVNVVTKAGTNAFHGTAYEFLRNDALDARTVFAAADVDPLKFNQFGGTVGGPIVKNKTFFFGAYEGLRVTRGVTLVSTVETPDTVSSSRSSSPTPSPTSSSRTSRRRSRPATSVIPADRSPGLQTRECRQQSGSDHQSELHPCAGALFNNTLQTTPDGIPDIGTANIPVSEKIDGDQFNIRVDHDVSANARILGRLLWDDRIQDDKQTIQRSEAFNQPVDEKGRNLTLGYTHILSNSMVNEARFGYSYRKRSLLANNEGVPNVTFVDGVVAIWQLPDQPGLLRAEDVPLGGHRLVEPREPRDQVRRRSPAHSRQFRFRGPPRRLPVPEYPRLCDGRSASGHDHGDQSQHRAHRAEHPQLPLLGDRVLRPGRLEAAAEPDREPRAAPRMVRPSERGERPAHQPGARSGADIFEQIANGTVGQVDQVVPDDWNNFGPRLGASWDPWGDGRLAIRGGYGIAYERLFNNSITNIRFNPPFYSFAVANPANVASQAGVRIAYGPMNPDGTIRNEPITITGDNRNIGVQPGMNIQGNIIGWNPAFGTSQQSLRVPDPNTKDAFSHNWFVGAQTELMWDMVLEANYVGNVGRNYGRLVDYNTVRGDLFDGRLNRLNPGFGGINFRAMLARAEYHGLQLQLNRRFKDGFSGQITYTLGKAMDTGSDVQVGALPVDARALDLEWAPADFDVRHRFGVNWLWEIPWMRDATGLTGTLLGGWQVNGITALQSGFPFSVFTNVAVSDRRLQRRRRQQRSPEHAELRHRTAQRRPPGLHQWLVRGGRLPAAGRSRRPPAERLSWPGLREH